VDATTNNLDPSFFFFLTESLPPIFDMGDDLKEHKCNRFSIGKVVDRKIPF
jgi:hypothetical protein